MGTRPVYSQMQLKRLGIESGCKKTCMQIHALTFIQRVMTRFAKSGTITNSNNIDTD